MRKTTKTNMVSIIKNALTTNLNVGVFNRTILDPAQSLLISCSEQKVYTNSSFNSSVLNTTILVCFLNNLSLDQMGQFSFQAKAKKSISSKNSLKSFSGQLLANVLASLNNSLYSLTETNLTYRHNCKKTSSNLLLSSLDLDNNSLEYLFNSLSDCSGDINLNEGLDIINLLVNDSCLKNENKMFVSTTNFTQANPCDFNSLNLPFLASLDSFNTSSSVSLLFFNNSSNLSKASSLSISLTISSRASSDQLTQENLLNSALTSSGMVMVAVPIYSLPLLFFLKNCSIFLDPKSPSFLRASNCFSSSNLLNSLTFNTSFQFTSGNFFFASSYPGTDNVNVAILVPPLISMSTPKSTYLFKSFALNNTLNENFNENFIHSSNIINTAVP